MTWTVKNKVNNFQWPGAITDAEKSYWESSPEGKSLIFTEVMPPKPATKPEAVKEAPKKKTRKRTKKQPESVKPDGDGSNTD